MMSRVPLLQCWLWLALTGEYNGANLTYDHQFHCRPGLCDEVIPEGVQLTAVCYSTWLVTSDQKIEMQLHQKGELGKGNMHNGPQGPKNIKKAIAFSQWSSTLES